IMATKSSIFASSSTNCERKSNPIPAIRDTSSRSCPADTVLSATQHQGNHDAGLTLSLRQPDTLICAGLDSSGLDGYDERFGWRSGVAPDPDRGRRFAVPEGVTPGPERARAQR